MPHFAAWALLFVAICTHAAFPAFQVLCRCFWLLVLDSLHSLAACQLPACMLQVSVSVSYSLPLLNSWCQLQGSCSRSSSSGVAVCGSAGSLGTPHPSHHQTLCVSCQQRIVCILLSGQPLTRSADIVWQAQVTISQHVCIAVEAPLGPV